MRQFCNRPPAGLLSATRQRVGRQGRRPGRQRDGVRHRRLLRVDDGEPSAQAMMWMRSATSNACGVLCDMRMIGSPRFFTSRMSSITRRDSLTPSAAVGDARRVALPGNPAYRSDRTTMTFCARRLETRRVESYRGPRSRVKHRRSRSPPTANAAIRGRETTRPVRTVPSRSQSTSSHDGTEGRLVSDASRGAKRTC